MHAAEKEKLACVLRLHFEAKISFHKVLWCEICFEGSGGGINLKSVGHHLLQVPFARRNRTIYNRVGAGVILVTVLGLKVIYI
jgi:hypothetical protein